MKRGKEEKKRKWNKKEIKTGMRNDRKIGKEGNGNKFSERRWEENIQKWREKDMKGKVERKKRNRDKIR